MGVLMSIFSRKSKRPPPPRKKKSEPRLENKTFANNAQIEFAGGIEWLAKAIYPMDEALELFRQRDQANLIIECGTGDSALIGGYSRGDWHKSQAIHSLAVVFAKYTMQANISGPAIYFYPLGERYGLIAVQNGIPIPGMDILDSESVVQRAYTEFLEQNANSTLYQAEEMLEGAVLVPLSDLIEFCGPDSALKRPPKRIPKSLIFLIVLMICAMAGGAYWIDLQEREEAAKKAAQVDINRLYADGIDALLRNEGEPGESVLRRMAQTALQIPTQVDGWQAQSIDCVPSGTCTTLYKRLFGTIEGFKSKSDPKVSITLQTPDSLKAIFTLLDSEDTASTQNRSVITRKSVPSLSDLTATEVPQLQLFKDAGLMAEVKQFANLLPDSVKAQPPALQASVKNPVRRAEYRLSAPLGYLLAPDLRIEEHTVIKSLKLSELFSQANSKFQLEGYIYAQD